LAGRFGRGGVSAAISRIRDDGLGGRIGRGGVSADDTHDGLILRGGIRTVSWNEDIDGMDWSEVPIFGAK